MIRTILIEDERKIAEEFKRLLQEASADTELIGSFSTVKESIEYLSANEPPDLIFSDVQLSDGLSFDIFNQVQIKSPVVFITGHEEFMPSAFEQNGIGYLLKPIDERDLEKILTKYKTFESHFNADRKRQEPVPQRSRSRLIVRKGIENVALKTDEIVLVYTEEKLVFAINREGRKFLVDKKLAELEQEFDNGIFFRANRQYIINIAFIKGYKTYDKVKLQVDLTIPDLHHFIIISQETAPFFRKWINEA